MIEITKNNEIILDGKHTGFGVAQVAAATRVFKFGGPAQIHMPRPRYAPMSDNPNADVAGQREFERDFRAVTGL